MWRACCGHSGEGKLVNGDNFNARWHRGTDGKASISLKRELQLWGPGHPTLYHATLEADGDKLEDDIGFRTIETRGTQILLNGQPLFLKGSAFTRRLLIAPGVRIANRMRKRCWVGRRSLARTTCDWRTIRMMRR